MENIISSTTKIFAQLVNQLTKGQEVDAYEMISSIRHFQIQQIIITALSSCYRLLSQEGPDTVKYQELFTNTAQITMLQTSLCLEFILTLPRERIAPGKNEMANRDRSYRILSRSTISHYERGDDDSPCNT